MSAKDKIAASLREFVDSDADAWSIAGIILDDLTDADVQDLAEARGFEVKPDDDPDEDEPMSERCDVEAEMEEVGCSLCTAGGAVGPYGHDDDCPIRTAGYPRDVSGEDERGD